jgi:hypothetical protein
MGAEKSYRIPYVKRGSHYSLHAYPPAFVFVLTFIGLLLSPEFLLPDITVQLWFRLLGKPAKLITTYLCASFRVRLDFHRVAPFSGIFAA